MNKCIGVGNKVCGVEFFDPEFPDDNVCDKCAEGLEGEIESCTRCGREVESDTLVSYGDWKLCELCQGDI